MFSGYQGNTYRALVVFSGFVTLVGLMVIFLSVTSGDVASTPDGPRLGASSASPVTSPAVPGRSSAVGVDVSNGPMTFGWWAFAAVALAALLVGVWLLIRRLVLRSGRRRRSAARLTALRQDWSVLRGREKAAMDRFLRYDTDPVALVQFPLMRDYRDPVIANVVQAMTEVRTLTAPAPPVGTTNVADSRYAAAVARFEAAVEIAERTARRVRLSRFSAQERAKVVLAQKLLRIALDGSASPAERVTAYRRVITELEGLIDLPEPARAAIETHLLLPIESRI